MISLRRRISAQWAGGVLVGLLAAYYLWVYRPLEMIVNGMDQRLEEFAVTLEQKAGPGREAESAADVSALLKRREVQARIRERVAGEILARLTLGPRIRETLKQPFQLIEFQNERQQRLETTEAVARKNKVKLGDGVALGYPDFRTDMDRPARLWAHLDILDSVVRTAIACGVAEVEEVSLVPSGEPARDDVLRPLILRLKLNGEVETLSRFLFALPLLGKECEAAGLKGVPTEKTPVFLDRTLLRKENPKALDQVRAELVIQAFVVDPVYRGGGGAAE